MSSYSDEKTHLVKILEHLDQNSAIAKSPDLLHKPKDWRCVSFGPIGPKIRLDRFSHHFRKVQRVMAEKIFFDEP